MRPGRISAGSSLSGWFEVMMRMRSGVSTTPSSTLRRPARLSSSSSLRSLARSELLVSFASASDDKLGMPFTRRCSIFDGTWRFGIAAGGKEIAAGGCDKFGSASIASWGANDGGEVIAGWTASEGSVPPCSAAGPTAMLHCATLFCFGAALASSSSDAVDISRVTFSVRKPLLGTLRVVSTVALRNRRLLPSCSRRCTIELAASMSSITKMTSLNVSGTAMSCPGTHMRRSCMTSISCWFVLIRARGMLMIDRPVCCARALIKEVFPVPGGPWRSSPSLCGYPSTPYLPAFC
mmetsp:Transcript_17643/g.38051  ORF Transcript_17643/g.38051 Transcript_17643/m.38051 type:complete len:293 (+) Transcript_17643:1114-1992(+)